MERTVAEIEAAALALEPDATLSVSPDEVSVLIADNDWHRRSHGLKLASREFRLKQFRKRQVRIHGKVVEVKDE